jgi:hypothetical protein
LIYPQKQQSDAVKQDGPSDPGLRRLLTYTFIALVLSVVLALFAVDLVIRWFDSGR